LGVNNKKVDVIYPGLGKNLKRASEKAIAQFRERRGLPDRFIFYLGTIEPRKNLSVLIHAYNKIKPQNVKLICAGDKGWLYEEVFRIVEELRLSRNVIFPGFVPKDELSLWYSACSVFVYPSAYEGFGLPVLEAMACGAITITTDAASLPEVAGKAALLVPPGDVDILADCIDDVLHTKGNYNELVHTGPEQAARFSWETAGRLTTRTYARALSLPDVQESIDVK
jgi:glycosyltransferase involved in cell wall biosynthesis